MPICLPSFVGAVAPAGGGLVNDFSISLDGSDDYIDVGDDSSLAPANLTLSCWFKASGSIGGFNYIISRNGNAYGAYYLRYTNANKFNYFLGFDASGGHKQGSFDTAFTLTDWNHVALTYDQNFIKGYVNGTEDFSTAETRSISYANDSTHGQLTWIGKGKFSDPAQGFIDEVGIFNSALSASDISSIYNSGVPNDISSTNLVGWWRMGDGTEAGSGTTVFDMSDNSNNGTLYNGPTFSSTVPS